MAQRSIASRLVYIRNSSVDAFYQAPSLQISPEFAERLSHTELRSLDDRAHSTVFQAHLPQPCVVKRLRPLGTPTVEFNGRLEHAAFEWRRASQIQNIQSFLGLWSYEGLPSIVAKYVGSTKLREYFATTHLSMSTKYILLHKIARALERMHQQTPPIVHTNLRASNILVDHNGDVFLCNIGVHDAIWSPGQFDPNAVRWQAPEKIRGGGHTTACDVYSFAMTILETMTLQDPFAGVPNPIHIHNVVLQGQIPARPEGLSNQLWQLLCQCWSLDFRARPTMGFVAWQLRVLSDQSRPGAQ